MNFIPDNLYHIYNRGNNSQLLFFERENYLYLLSKIRTHLYPLVDILAYCLMPNQFHLLVYIPSESHSSGDSKSPDELNKRIVSAIAIILRSYTRAINKKHGRTGSLFQSKTKAKNLSEKQNYAFTCFHYIHQNPVSAKLVNSIADWEFSSYQDYAGIRDGTLCSKVLAVYLLDIPIESNLFIQQSKSVKIENTEKESLL
ncbi:MAG: transposase [Cyclobacteriaceae bacterium]|nr:transposase [Cyclobacteriaceae bacterium]